MQYPSPLQMFSFTDTQFQYESSFLSQDCGAGSCSSPPLHFPPQLLDPDDYHSLILRCLHHQPLPSSVPDTSTTPSLSPPPPSEPSHDKGSSLQMPPPRKSPPCTGSTSRRRTMRKDRHSKIVTAKGPRDRRIRLSLDVSKKFFDLQDILGFEKPSKTIGWLLNKSMDAIKSVAFCSKCQRHHRRSSSLGGNAKTDSSTSECEFDSVSMKGEEVVVSGEVRALPKARRSANIRPPRKAISLDPAVAKETRAKARARARERTRMRKGLGQPPPPPVLSIKTLSFEKTEDHEKKSSTPTSQLAAEVNQEPANYPQIHCRRSSPGQQGFESARGSFPMMIAGECDEISIYDYDSSIIFNNAVDALDYFQEQCNMHSSGSTAEAQQGTADVHYQARAWEGFPIF